MFSRIKGIGNRENFDRLAGYAVLFTIGSIFFQAISAFTEGVGIFRFIDTVVGSTIAALAFGVVIVIAWELIIRGGTKYVTKTIIKWRTGAVKFTFLELSLVIVSATLALGLAYFSKNVSKENVYVVFQYFAPDPEQESDSTIYQDNSKMLAALGDRYTARMRPITDRYEKGKAAKRQQFQAKIENAEREIKYWQQREKDLNKKFTYMINKKRRELKQHEADLGAALATLTDRYAEETAATDTWKAGQESLIDKQTHQEAGLITTGNINKANIYNQWVQQYSRIWADFAGWAVVIAMLLIIFQAIFEELSEIEEEVVVSERFFEVGFLTELSEAFISTLVIPLRNQLRLLMNRQKLLPVKMEPTKAPTKAPTEGQTIELVGDRQIDRQIDRQNQLLSAKIDTLEKELTQQTERLRSLSDKGFGQLSPPTRRPTKPKTVGKKSNAKKPDLSVTLSEEKGQTIILVGKVKYKDISKFVDACRKWYERQFTAKTDLGKDRNRQKWEAAKPILKKLGADIKEKGQKVEILFIEYTPHKS